MKVKGIIGGVLLLCAGFLKWVQYDDHHSGAWFSNLFDSQIDTFMVVLLVIGTGLIIVAILQYFYERESGN